METNQIVARLVDCWNTGKLESLDELFAPNFVRHEPEIEARTTGREEYKQTISRYRNALSNFHSEAMDTIEQGNRLAFRFRTTGNRNSASIVFEGVNIMRLEGGRVVEDWVYFDVTGLQQKLAQAQAA
jgi:ketosteroid isomerase-like protein